MDKRELRKLICERKHQFSHEELECFSQQVCMQVLEHDFWLNAFIVLLYNSLPDEVDTHLLLDTGLKTGKQILLPVVAGEDLELRMYSEQMRKGSFGILEPVGKPFLDFPSIDLVIVPGIAFDAERHRLGRGRGYYDRFLSNLPDCKTMGLCFPFQLVESVPVDSHDIPMSEVISCKPDLPPLSAAGGGVG